MYVFIYNVVAGKRIKTHAYIYVCVHVYIQILNPCLQKKKTREYYTPTHAYMYVYVCHMHVYVCLQTLNSCPPQRKKHKGDMTRERRVNSHELPRTLTLSRRFLHKLNLQAEPSRKNKNRGIWPASARERRVLQGAGSRSHIPRHTLSSKFFLWFFFVEYYRELEAEATSLDIHPQVRFFS